MKLHIDGKFYELPQEVEDKLLLQFYVLLSQIYVSDAIPKGLRLAIKPLARHELEKKEKELNRAGYDGKVVRPAPGSDPALRLMELELGKLRGEGKLKDVTLYVSTETDSSTISALSLSIAGEGESGGSDTARGYIGERQDNSGEDARSSSREVVPYF